MRSSARSRLAFSALLPLACALLAACDVSGARAGTTERVPPARFRSAPRAAAPAPPGFRVAYGAVRDSVYAGWQEDFRRARFLEDVADWMNGWIRLPTDVTLTFAECGESNSYYRPEDRTVVVCFELVDELDALFERDHDRDQAVDDALLFTTLHEVGHALVSVLDLPVTGREEDAVDQLAALILVDGSDEGDVAAVNGVRGLPDDEQLDDLTFADEHALNGQRFYNVLCLVYGQNPAAHPEWTRDGTLPEERAERCPEEYGQTRAAWQKLLLPYLIQD
ncbi:MAG TPA: DUF4344 domain-containing metallopeptidase [Longimicrobium sp.]|nr:DUF4344 domain-containing metallopeptidase [Longimicrobium sp.]